MPRSNPSPSSKSCNLTLDRVDRDLRGILDTTRAKFIALPVPEKIHPNSDHSVGELCAILARQPTGIHPERESRKLHKQIRQRVDLIKKELAEAQAFGSQLQEVLRWVRGERASLIKGASPELASSGRVLREIFQTDPDSIQPLLTRCEHNMQRGLRKMANFERTALPALTSVIWIRCFSESSDYLMRADLPEKAALQGRIRDKLLIRRRDARSKMTRHQQRELTHGNY